MSFFIGYIVGVATTVVGLVVIACLRVSDKETDFIEEDFD